MAFERIVLVTRQTELEALVERFQTRSQAEFYLTQSGQGFEPIAERHHRYDQSLQAVKQALPSGIKHHIIERRDLIRYRFESGDIVVALGQDGLVANIAKYLDGQPLIAVNPDPKSIDGILLPIQVSGFGRTLQRTLSESARIQAVTMAEAVTSDGQRIRATNDLFIGTRSHVSVRYRIECNGQAEEHSSSGLIVSTGVGSTGWLRSVYAGAIGVARSIAPEIQLIAPPPVAWDARELIFNVREPWPSMNTGADLVCGRITAGQKLNLTSRMPLGGVIFGDGMEKDFIEFNSGTDVSIGIALQSLTLVLS